MKGIEIHYQQMSGSKVQEKSFCQDISVDNDLKNIMNEVNSRPHVIDVWWNTSIK